MECTGTNEAIDDASFFIAAFINRINKRQRLINSIENRIFKFTQNENHYFEIIEIIYFFFQYRHCKTIHHIINLRSSNPLLFKNLNWYLKNEIILDNELPF